MLDVKNFVDVNNLLDVKNFCASKKNVDVENVVDVKIVCKCLVNFECQQMAFLYGLHRKALHLLQKRLLLSPPKFNVFGVNAFLDVKHFCLTSKNCFYVKIVLTSKTCLTSKACVTSKDVSSSTNMFDVKIVLKKILKMSKGYDSHVLCSCRSCFYCRSCSAAPAWSSRNSR